MEEMSDRAQSSITHRSRKSKNGEKKVPQRGLGVAQLEKLRLEEQQKQQQHSLVVNVNVISPNHHLQRQMNMKAFSPTATLYTKTTPLPPPPAPSPSPSPSPTFSLDLGSPRDSIMCLAAGGLSVPMNRNGGSALMESSSCITHVWVAPDSMMATAKVLAPSLDPFQQGLGAEIYGSDGGVGAHQELRLFEPSQLPPGPPTELPMMGFVSSSGAVQSEPPSNQIYSTNATNWPEEDKISDRKRPRPFSEENLVHTSKSNRLEHLNLDPVHLFRSSIATSFEPVQITDQWRAKIEIASPAGKYPLDWKCSSDSGQGHTPRISCTGQAFVRDSCSSTTSLQPGFQLPWKGYENDISSCDETPSDFLTLGLSTSVNDNLHCRPKGHLTRCDGKHSAISDACEECGLLSHLQQERCPEPDNPSMYHFGEALSHRSKSMIDDRGIIPFYKFFSHGSNTKGIADSAYQDNTNKTADLDLRLSL